MADNLINQKVEQGFIQDVDYQVLAQNGKNPQGGRPTNEYHLTVSCLEFFIARKVRDVFEVYRQVFHEFVDRGIRMDESATVEFSTFVQNQRVTKWSRFGLK